jgi:hypothetical protein
MSGSTRSMLCRKLFCFDMQDEKKQRWLYRLCELAADEQDPDKLLALVKEIIRVVEEKEEKQEHLKPLDCSARNGEAA